MDFFEKIKKKPVDDLNWNIPEKKVGIVNLVGGNSQNFKTEVRVAEFLNKNFPIETLNLVLPDILKNKLPNMPNFKFLSSTESGSFKNSEEIKVIFNSADFNLVLGDLSKNSVTRAAFSSAYEFTEKPLLITRDAVDLMIEDVTEKNLANERLILFGSMPQLIKLFRAIYYPKMLLLTQSLIQVADALHKFTLSYPMSIITLHNNQILIAKDGKVKSIAIEESKYSPISIWQGELAAKIVALNLYNPNNFMNASISAIFF